MRSFLSSSVSRSTVVLSTLLLGACAYATEGSNQDITFLSPNAKDAKCFAYVNKLKYQVFPPQTINIKKSEKDMIIECNAPGNRNIRIEVPSKIEGKAVWGTPVGAAWDYASSSLYSYPDVIAIDFSQEEVKPNPPPKHNNDDIRQPEDHDLEEFLPSEPRLNSDKNKVVTPIERSEHGNIVWNDEEDEPAPMEEEVISDATISPSEESFDKGDLQAVIDEMKDNSAENIEENSSVEAESLVQSEVISDVAVSADTEADQQSSSKAVESNMVESSAETVTEVDTSSSEVISAPSSVSSEAGEGDDFVPTEADSSPVELVPGE